MGLQWLQMIDYSIYLLLMKLEIVVQIYNCRLLGEKVFGVRASAMKDYEIEEKKQAAADVLFQYSKFALACLGNQARPCDMRLHLMKEISGLPTSLRKASSHTAASPDVMGESSNSGTARLDKVDSFRGL